MNKMSKFQSYSRFLMWFMALLLSALAAGCGGGGGGRDPILGLSLPALVSIAVAPKTASIPITGTQQFTATATYSDGSSRDVTASSTWAPGTPAVALVEPATGLATGFAGGTSLITATFGGKSDSANLTVTTATSALFIVTPATASIPVSGTQQFAAIQIFSDGTSQDRTTTSVWSTSGASAANASVGAATGNALGKTVTPVGVPVVISATFTPVGGSALVATPAALTVNNATSVSFVVKPATASIPRTGNQHFTATETFSNGTTFDRTELAAWTKVDAPFVAGNTVSNLSPNCLGAVGCSGSGVATGVDQGTSTITATYGIYIAGYAGVPGSSDTVATVLAARTATLTVNNATVMSIQVTPALASIAKGSNQNYLATAILSDGTTNDVTANSLTTWTATDVPTPPGATPVASVGSTGVAAGLNLGQSDIRAAFGGKTSPAGGAILTVIAGALGPGPALAVDCLSVCPFGLLAYDAITNSTGPSHIYGDVAITIPTGVIASVSGPATGFNDAGPVGMKTSTIVTNSTGVTPGVVITATDNGPVASRAALSSTVLPDLNALYTALLTRPVTGPAGIATVLPAVQATPVLVLPSGGTFGAGQNLTGWILGPGVYTQTGAYALDNTKGPLVLDAGGNPDAVFIIRSTGAGGFTSTSGSVVLQGNAQAKNIFWFADAPFIGPATFFQGTMVAGHAIVVLGFANVQGRMLAGAFPGTAAGALTLTSTNIVTVPQ